MSYLTFNSGIVTSSSPLQSQRLTPGHPVSYGDSHIPDKFSQLVHTGLETTPVYTLWSEPLYRPIAVTSSFPYMYGY